MISRGVKSVLPPPCKSALQRSLFLAFLAGGDCRIHYRRAPFAVDLAEDVRVFLRALVALGAKVREGGLGSESWIQLRGNTARKKPRTHVDFELGKNGTALRFLLAYAGVFGGEFGFCAEPQLSRRPLAELVPLLRSWGCSFDFAGEDGRVPFRIRSPGLSEPPRLELDLAKGSQAASGLCLCLAAWGRKSEVVLHGGLGYLSLSLDALSRFGCRVIVSPDGANPDGGARTELRIPDSGLENPRDLAVPADPSAAAFVLALAHAQGSELMVQGLDAKSSHPDLRLLDDLVALGSTYGFDGEQLHFVGRPGVGDVEILDLAERPDSFPPLAVLLSARPGRHCLGDAEKLRSKESDRIAVLARALQQLGLVVAEATEEGKGILRFEGRLPGSGHVLGDKELMLDPCGDHRMAMSFAILGKIHRITVQMKDRSCVAKSWPGFFTAICDL